MVMDADTASEFLKSLANRHRMLILCRLWDSPQSVGQLADFLAIRRSTVSQHLAMLRRERLVSGHRDGQTIRYQIESEPARAIIATLYTHYCKDGLCRAPSPAAARTPAPVEPATPAAPLAPTP